MRWTRRSAVAVTTAAVLVGGGLALAQGAASRSLPATAVPASSSTSVDGSVEDLLAQVDALEAAVAASAGVDDSGDTWDDSDGRVGGESGRGSDDTHADDRGDDDRGDDDRGGDDDRDDDDRDDDDRGGEHGDDDDRDDD